MLSEHPEIHGFILSYLILYESSFFVIRKRWPDFILLSDEIAIRIILRKTDQTPVLSGRGIPFLPKEQWSETIFGAFPKLARRMPGMETQFKQSGFRAEKPECLRI